MSHAPNSWNHRWQKLNVRIDQYTLDGMYYIQISGDVQRMVIDFLIRRQKKVGSNLSVIMHKAQSGYRWSRGRPANQSQRLSTTLFSCGSGCDAVWSFTWRRESLLSGRTERTTIWFWSKRILWSWFHFASCCYRIWSSDSDSDYAVLNWKIQIYSTGQYR